MKYYADHCETIPGLSSQWRPTIAKSLQSCPTLCDPIDGSPSGSPVPGILQARTLEWVAISFSNAWKWKWSRSVVSDSSWPHGLQPTRLLHPWDFPGKSTAVGCHCLLQGLLLEKVILSLVSDGGKIIPQTVDFCGGFSSHLQEKS